MNASSTRDLLQIVQSKAISKAFLVFIFVSTERFEKDSERVSLRKKFKGLLPLRAYLADLMAKGRGRGGFSDGGSKCGRCCSGFMRRVRSDLLLVLIIIGVVIGFVIGALVNDPVNKIDDVEDKKTVLMLIGFAGELFMNMLKMLILPLIVASLICALASLDAKATGRVGRRALMYYISTTILAVILGIVLVVSIQPGDTKVEKETKEVERIRTLDAFLDLIRYALR